MVEHDEALRHILHCIVETAFLRLQANDGAFVFLGYGDVCLGPRPSGFRLPQALLAAQVTDAQKQGPGDHQFQG